MNCANLAKRPQEPNFGGADRLRICSSDQTNYWLAAETSSRFFNRVREVANQTQDANRRKGLEDLLALRDSFTAALAKGDAAVWAISSNSSSRCGR